MPDPAPNPGPIEYASPAPPPPPQREPAPAPRSVSGKKALLGVLGVALLLQVALVLFLMDVRERKSTAPALPATAPARP